MGSLVEKIQIAISKAKQYILTISLLWNTSVLSIMYLKFWNLHQIYVIKSQSVE